MKKVDAITLILFGLMLGIILTSIIDGFLKKEEVSIPESPTSIYYIYVNTSEEELEKVIPEEVIETIEDVSKNSIAEDFTITAYDNSVESQGQWVDQTATGFNLKGHSLESAKCIAVDPKVIPLGSKVEINFDEEYKHLDGIYVARDTGGAIKGNRIDLFMGDGVSRGDVMRFGRRQAKVRILE